MAQRDIRLGSWWRKETLGSTAIYKVIGIEKDVVSVRVQQAPGLRAGTAFRFMRSAFLQMEEIPRP